ncbi:myo-inosose-2 dehydratase [Roseibium sp. SCP14]|uniref:myo-inosose-2 dehydratase n=1 Tax=Roseibium sp. SCP14 TaxID=3141375 RepID=UPI003335C267
MSDIRLGISPLSWTNQAILDLGDDVSYDQCIREASAAGFTGVELGRKFPESDQEILDTLGSRGLRPVSSWYSGYLAERDVEAEWPDAMVFADRLLRLGCSVMVYGECGCGPDLGAKSPLDQRPRVDLFDLKTYAGRLTQLGKRLADRGIALVYHHHMMQPVETSAQIDELLTECGPEVGLLLDTGHLALAGEDYVPVMKRWWSRIDHIHLKDIRRQVISQLDPSRDTFNDGVRKGMFTVPGDGDLDFAPLARQIAEHGWHGWLLVEAEQDPEIAEPAAMARTAFTYLEKILTASGVSFERNIHRVC